MPYLLIILNVILMSAGQLLFKKSAVFLNAHAELSQINRFLLNPWFYLAGLSFTVATIIYVKILTNMQLSAAYPTITTLAYILTILGSIYFFNEKLSLINVIGISIIFIGIALASYSK